MLNWVIGILLGLLGAPTPVEAPQLLKGIDGSHHKGSIDWPRVKQSGITFAYLKATEGTGFVDPRFQEHRKEALEQGLKVGGYHYFQLCSDGEAQARHFINQLGTLQENELPPAIDLELAGSCSTPPPREQLLQEVREFIQRVEWETQRRIVVYLYPEFEDRYRFSTEIDRRMWVRRLGDQPPTRPWWIWQKSQTAQVQGIDGGVDLNLMKTP